LVVGAAETEVGYRNFGFELVFAEAGARAAQKTEEDRGGLRGAKVSEGGCAVVLGGGAAVIALVLKFRAEESGEAGATGFADERPEFTGVEATEIAKVIWIDEMVFDCGGFADAICGAEVDFGADAEGAAVVVEEVTGEAVVEYGADLAASVWIYAGDADEAGFHAGEMCDY
jgi:hypothetical protein